MKRTCGVLLLLLMPSMLYAQLTPALRNRRNLICWQEQRKLTWADFQAKVRPLGVDSTISEAAAAPVLTVIGYIDEDQKNNFLVRAAFDPQKAWVRDSSAYLLQHEQLHFDICELVARRIRVSIAQAYKRGQDVFDSACGKEIQRLLTSEGTLQAAYDRETAHGLLETEQKRWREKITKEHLSDRANSLKAFERDCF
jgi:hypothetical protein